MAELKSNSVVFKLFVDSICIVNLPFLDFAFSGHIALDSGLETDFCFAAKVGDTKWLRLGGIVTCPWAWLPITTYLENLIVGVVD